METSEMGRVTCVAHIENLKDLWDAQRGIIAPGDVRRITIEDALVDTGASTLSLPMHCIRELGLEKVRDREIRTAGGPRVAGFYEPVRLTILDRDCTVDVREIGDDLPTLIGQIPLEAMDFVVDPARQRLIGNPAHGGQWISEVY
ncbi:MAG TPA: aspartyl protease family protein [Lacipirellulaceae bacterium]|nr:aspartyl protease family protein [Lacipirellulaceae bacterium]